MEGDRVMICCEVAICNKEAVYFYTIGMTYFARCEAHVLYPSVLPLCSRDEISKVMDS